MDRFLVKVAIDFPAILSVLCPAFDMKQITPKQKCWVRFGWIIDGYFSNISILNIFLYNGGDVLVMLNIIVDV